MKPLWDKIVEFVLSVSNDIMELWNTTLQPIFNWLVQTFGPIISGVITEIINVWEKVHGFFIDQFGTLIDALKGVMTFITGVFTLNWEKAWDGIKTTFAALWDSLVLIVKAPINAIIAFINSMISGIAYGFNALADILNFFSLDIPEWVPLVGGGKLGFDLPHFDAPQIPYLAQGAVLPPNKPFMAMVGDQSHGTNVEAPLATIQEAVANVMGDMVGGMMAGFEATVAVQKDILEAVLGIDIGEDKIYEAYQSASQKMNVIEGGGLF